MKDSFKSKIAEWQKELESATASEVLTFANRSFGSGVAFASSLGAEDQLITDLIRRHVPEMVVFTLDTGRLFPETYELISRTNARYGMKMQVFFPDAARVEEMVNEKGIDLFFNSIENRKQCCHVRKVEPLQRAFRELDAWVCGLRRDQSVTRSEVAKVEWDEANGLVKFNPLADWSEKEVWDYIDANNVPYNKLHKQGFPSIGCQPCTRAIEEGEDVRAGRWWWENPESRECGLHKK